MEELINLTIDGIQIQAKKGTTILEAARNARNRHSNFMLFKGYK